MKSARRIAVGIEREFAVHARTAAAELALRRAARSGRRVLVGPFLGEVGYELLYWIPFVRHTLAQHGIPREQVATLTRGGAGSWYRDFAADYVELFDLVEPDTLVSQVAARRRRARDAKQLRGDRFDRELVRLARERIGAATVLHPSLMFARLRGLWFRDEPLSATLPQLDFRRLYPAAPPAGLPERYVAVKLYGSDCFPDEAPVRERVQALLERLAGKNEIVLLNTGVRLDNHDDWSAELPRVHSLAPLLQPRDNLAVQAAAVAGARGLVSTYGGFSYLGPLVGVPTLALHARQNFHPAHLALARTAFAGIPYDVAGIDDEPMIGHFLDTRLGTVVEVER
jgi:hypothetical protein